MRLRLRSKGSDRPAPSAAPFLAFLHIPKTGGKTLAAILHHHYGDAFQGGIGVDAEMPAPNRIPNVFSRAEYLDDRFREIAANPAVQAFAGHITFGLRERLPSGARWLTILRDPVDRTLSQYYFLLPPRDGGRTTGRSFVPPWLPPPPPELTLDESVGERGYIPDNLQTRMLCGLVSPFDPLPPDALDRATRNLREYFAFVGTTERLQEFLALLNVAFRWPTVAYKRSRNPAYPGRAEVPDDLVRLAAERNVLDFELWACANELLDQAITDAGREVQREVEIIARAEGLRKDRRKGTGDDPVRSLRTLPLTARVELALKEGDLAEARLQIRRFRSRVKWRLRRREPEHDEITAGRGKAQTRG